MRFAPAFDVLQDVDQELEGAPFALGGVVDELLVQLYADAGDLPELSVSVDAGQNRVANGFATLTGYLLDCTAAPCAKIAQ